MSLSFVLEDQAHAETVANFSDEASAIRKVRRLFATPWNEPPNLAPCMDWETCGREYDLLVYETSTSPWTLVIRRAALIVTAKGRELLLSDDGVEA